MVLTSRNPRCTPPSPEGYFGAQVVRLRLESKWPWVARPTTKGVDEAGTAAKLKVCLQTRDDPILRTAGEVDSGVASEFESIGNAECAL